jgi:Ca2+/Na+ antiporter
MYLILLHAHSILRWILMFLLLYSIVVSLWKWLSKSTFTKSDSLAAAITVHMSHLQLLLGFILYFISSKVMFSKDAMISPIVRFFTVEHISMMVIAIALLTIGNIQSKKTEDNRKKAKLIFWWFFVALIVIMAAIPWPSKGLGSGWY